MGPATPVEVFLFWEFFAAVSAHFDAMVNFALSILKLYNSLFHLFPLV